MCTCSSKAKEKCPFGLLLGGSWSETCRRDPSLSCTVAGDGDGGDDHQTSCHQYGKVMSANLEKPIDLSLQ